MRERQQKILEHIRKVGIASFHDLAVMFGVSSFTIRRDVDYLAQSRLLVRIKGGAQRIETASQFYEPGLLSRLQVNLKQKEKIAEKALEFIFPGESIFLDGSSTIACLARKLAVGSKDITVITNSVLVALELAENPSIRVIGIGGILDGETMSFVGFDADSYANSFYIEKAFFSCTGLIPEEGTFENAAFNRNTKLLVAERAQLVYLLIDSSKFGKRALNHVFRTEEIDVLITEKALEPKDQQIMQESRVKVRVAGKKKERIKDKG
jgi:DeoR/GlpR family transcriptional regulator of sugar metabolism